MDIHITQPDLEAKLTQSAAQQVRHPDELVQQVLAQYFDEAPLCSSGETR